jgi:2-polyprenyl-3-methyl-5-hydroxy-6-metoxy-1,4-benzoquinol methylase
MDGKKRDFDKEAPSWDEEPGRVRLAASVAEAIAGEIRLEPRMDILDFGCGTGLLSLLLQPHVRSVTCADSSRGMLEVLSAKVERFRLTNVIPLHLDLDQGDIIPGVYHLITCSMALHHIRDIRPLLNAFFSALTPGGHLCIADLDMEHGLFHSDNEGVFHSGFDRAALKEELRAAGFDEVRDRTAAEMKKPGADGVVRTFGVFLVTGSRRP